MKLIIEKIKSTNLETQELSKETNDKISFISLGRLLSFLNGHMTV